MIDRMAQLQKALDLMGNTYSLEDVVAMIDSGVMQSFAKNDTWVVTQIIDFPRKRVLELFLIVGDLEDLEEIYNDAVAFAQMQGCTLMRGFGRPGWKKFAEPRGWTNGTTVYLKTME